MRKTIIPVFVLAIVCAVLVSGLLTGSSKVNKSIPLDRGSTPHAAQTSPQDPPGTIDGSVNPELIPDVVAYQLFFNFFSNRTPGERGKLQAYLKQTALAGVKLDSLLALANHYRQRVAPIDSRAQAIRNSNQSLTMESGMGVDLQLAPLQAEKEAIVQEVIAKIPDFVGHDGALAIRQHIEGRVKPQTKIEVGPSMSLTNLSR
jgi:hypothetical protein